MTAISTLISAGGGGGGSNVNDNRVINSTATSITTESGEVWLKSGQVSTDISTYPGATRFDGGFGYSTTNWSIASEMSRAGGITWDGSYFYVADRTRNGQIHKYNAAGVYQNVYFHGDNTSSDNENFGLHWDATTGYFYVADQWDGTAQRINSSYTQDSGWSMTGMSGIYGITVLGNYIYTLRGNYVHKDLLTSSGSSPSISVSISAQTGSGQAQDLTTDGTYLYVKSTSGTVYQYTEASIGYTGLSFSINALSNAATAIGAFCFKNGNIFTTNSIDDKVFEWTPVQKVGLAAQANTDGGTIYTRIL